MIINDATTLTLKDVYHVGNLIEFYSTNIRAYITAIDFEARECTIREEIGSEEKEGISFSQFKLVAIVGADS